MNLKNQFREHNILPAFVFLRGFGLKNHQLCSVDISTAHSPLNLEPLLQEVSKAFHKGSVSSLHRPSYEKDLSLDCKTWRHERRKLEWDEERRGRGEPERHQGSHKLRHQSVKSEVRYPTNLSVTQYHPNSLYWQIHLCSWHTVENTAKSDTHFTGLYFIYCLKGVRICKQSFFQFLSMLTGVEIIN